MSEPPLLKHTAVLREHLALAGARVADVGCGDGGLVRVMTRAGAAVLGIDPGPQQLARARAAEPAGDESYLCAFGEQLPLADASLDAVVYFNALHHVPVEVQGAALDEAARVVRPGGFVYVQEPLAEGTHFALVQPIEDETEVRAQAYEALQAACADEELEEVEEFRYRAPHRVASFEAFRDGLIAVDPKRRPTVEAAEESLRQAFMAAGEQREGAFWFEIPSRLNLLQRI
ncbi:methyltransferase domain-containing protein [Pelagibius litoralis]|uniref:Methyltransferase domain-containing protein n=1 Tax=Pelagibius litoralis TaxID=374515 RepID=A0A967C5D6_9PROT|nr:class I SAM-dependent methyltransferase [Pelagibius litoralis]NIA69054.1 methyltransferase domain-containing protein [Pelagibius litoralis]